MKLPMLLRHGIGLGTLAIFLVSGPTLAASLRGSRESMMRQNRVAHQHDYTFLKTTRHVDKFIDMGLLVKLPGNRNYELDDEVSFPFARPAVKTFIERLSKQFRAATGEKLVVTSLTRPNSRQPHNSSSLSVHPTGMAVDIRYSRNRVARRWIENVFLELEKKRVIEATKERRPPHYHVAVFPKPYLEYVKRMDRKKTRSIVTHRVASGDTLWLLARHYKTSVAQLRVLNDLGGSQIFVGQKLRIR